MASVNLFRVRKQGGGLLCSQSSSMQDILKTSCHSSFLRELVYRNSEFIEEVLGINNCVT